MDHLYQTTMLLPASYAVISEEEMTYLDGGKEILLGSVISKILLSAEPTMVCPRLAPSTTPGIR